MRNAITFTRGEYTKDLEEFLTAEGYLPTDGTHPVYGDYDVDDEAEIPAEAVLQYFMVDAEEHWNLMYVGKPMPSTYPEFLAKELLKLCKL